jgi:hypothetical protein
MPGGALIRCHSCHLRLMILSPLSAVRLRPRAPEARSGRRAGEAGLDLVQKVITSKLSDSCLAPGHG